MMVSWATADFQGASKCMAIFIYFVVENSPYYGVFERMR